MTEVTTTTTTTTTSKIENVAASVVPPQPSEKKKKAPTANAAAIAAPSNPVPTTDEPPTAKSEKKPSVKKAPKSVQFEDKPPQTWTSEDVKYWLKDRQFSEDIIHSFTKEHIAGDFLVAHVNDTVVLTELGLSQSIQQKRLKFELDKDIQRHNSKASVKNEPSTTNPPTPPIPVKKEPKTKPAAAPAPVAVVIKNEMPKSSVPVKAEQTSGKSKRSRDDIDATDESTSAAASTNKRTKAAIKTEKATSTLVVPPALSPHHLVPALYKPLNNFIPLIPYPRRPQSPAIPITTMIKKELAYLDRVDDKLNPNDYDISLALDQLTANPLMSFQHAKTGQSKCRECEYFIHQNTIRLGIRTYFGPYAKIDAITAWFHPKCGLSFTTTHDTVRVTSSTFCMGCKLLLGDPAHANLRPELQQVVFIAGPLGDNKKHFDYYCQCCAQLAFSSKLNCSLPIEQLMTLDGFCQLHPVLQQRVKDIIQKSDLY